MPCLPSFAPNPASRRSLLTLALLPFLVVSWPEAVTSSAVPPASPSEVRALWVLRTSLTTADRIDRMVGEASRHGFNTLLVQVRGRGDAFFTSSLEPRASALAAQPATFDPLAHAIERAHAAGLQVHAWVNVNLVSSALDLPTARSHVVQRHPEWLMVPRALAAQLAVTPVHSPAYVGRLARWSRDETNGVEGLYASPVVPEAAAHVAEVLSELVTRYPVDGVHLDYVRYPSAEFDYGPRALDEFRRSVLPDLTATERTRLDRKLQDTPFAYTDMFPVRWASFRRSRLTALVMRARTAIKSVRPGLVLSAASVPDVEEASHRLLQDWPIWLQQGLIDVACPMIYTPDRAQFLAQISALERTVVPVAMWAGIGAYRLSPDETVANILATRRVGAAGFALFSYDSVTDPTGPHPDFLGDVARLAFAGVSSAGAGAGR